MDERLPLNRKRFDYALVSFLGREEETFDLSMWKKSHRQNFPRFICWAMTAVWKSFFYIYGFEMLQRFIGAIIFVPVMNRPHFESAQCASLCGFKLQAWTFTCARKTVNSCLLYNNGSCRARQCLRGKLILWKLKSLKFAIKTYVAEFGLILLVA